MHQENIGGDDTVIGGECHGTLDGLEAGIDDVNRAYVVSSEESFQGGAARKLRGFESWPAAEEVTKDGRILFGKLLQDPTLSKCKLRKNYLPSADYVATGRSTLEGRFLDGNGPC